MFDLGVSHNGLMSLAIVTLALPVGLWIWFQVNRASVRANKQLYLLQQIAEQQRQQTALLESMAQSARVDGAINNEDLSSATYFKGFIPER